MHALYLQQRFFLSLDGGLSMYGCHNAKIAHMTTHLKCTSALLIILASCMLTACFVEDPGPRQETERSYGLVDFDRLEMGSGFQIDVEHGNYFSIAARGDRRNVDDLIVEKKGSTLVIRYRDFRERRYDTFIEITMPTLHAVNFSGGSESHVYNFHDAQQMDINLSGGSMCQLDVEAPIVSTELSGGSFLNLRGSAGKLNADISGASALRAFHFSIGQADIELSGASDAEVTVNDVLNVAATGASHLVYRGNPVVTADVSDSSSAHPE